MLERHREMNKVLQGFFNEHLETPKAEGTGA
jgi:hypothetical protein